MEQSIEQQIPNQHIEQQLGFEAKTSSPPSDPNSQNPKQSDEYGDADEMAMQIIGEELRNLVLNQALSEEAGKENGKIKENEVEWNDDEEEGGEYGYDHYNDNDDENDNENDVENENGYEGDAKEIGFNNARIRRKHGYPLRPDAQDCPYYMKTGMCKFGSNCKFNHPSRRKYQQGTKEKGKQKEESQERPGQIECKVVAFIIVSNQDKKGKSLDILCMLVYE